MAAVSRTAAPDLAFVVLRLRALATGADVALVELEGRFTASVRRRLGRPRLLLEHGRDRLEVEGVGGGEAVAGPDGEPWRATFAVPLEALEHWGIALAVGRELLVDLPAPTREQGGGGDATDAHVRLAREVNALRARADEARAAAAAALAQAEEHDAARAAAAKELLGERHARDELATRLEQFQVALEQTRRDHAVALEARDEELERLRGERDAAAGARVEAAEAEVNELRRALKSARADLEAMRRRAHAAEGHRVRDHERRTAEVEGRGSDDRERERDERPRPDPPTARLVPAGEPAAPVIGDEDRAGDEDDPGSGDPASGGEGVRVLGRRRPRPRRDAEPPAEPLPGTAAIGARHIEPGTAGAGAVGTWVARALAFGALLIAIVVVALLLA